MKGFLRKPNILFQYSRCNACMGLLKRFHSTDLVSNTVSNSDGRLRLEEERYCNDFSTPLKLPIHNVLKSLSNETVGEFSKSFMMVSETQAKLLHQLVKLLRPMNVLEIGGFTGYSAIAMGSALPPKATLDSLELDEQHAAVAVKYIKEAGLEEFVNVMVGSADKSLASLSSSSRKYDLIFLDANKGAYIKYFDFIMNNNMLSRNGVIIADNVLTFGQVHKEAGYGVESASTASKNIKKTAMKLHRFNDHILRDTRVEVVILPIFDGVSLIRRKSH